MHHAANKHLDCLEAAGSSDAALLQMWPADALRLVLQTAAHDPALRMRRAAMHLLTTAVVGNFPSASKALAETCAHSSRYLSLVGYLHELTSTVLYLRMLIGQYTGVHLTRRGLCQHCSCCTLQVATYSTIEHELLAVVLLKCRDTDAATAGMAFAMLVQMPEVTLHQGMHAADWAQVLAHAFQSKPSPCPAYQWSEISDAHVQRRIVLLVMLLGKAGICPLAEGSKHRLSLKAPVTSTQNLLGSSSTHSCRSGCVLVKAQLHRMDWRMCL